MKKVLLILVGLALCLYTYSQSNTDKNTTANSQINKENLNELNFFYGDAIPLNLVEALSTGITEIFTGVTTKKNSIGVFGLGYRYKVSRLRFGVDIGYMKGKTEVSINWNKAVDYVTNDDQFLVMPTMDLIYLKKGKIELYGSAGLGSLYTFTKYNGITPDGVEKIKNIDKNKFNDFAFQLTPITMRFGNEHFGGFIGIGFGYKGIMTTGLSYKF